jgi:hypothetical protein
MLVLTAGFDCYFLFLLLVLTARIAARVAAHVPAHIAYVARL